MHDGHEHHHGAAGGLDEARALVDYMISHNEHHTEELRELAERLRGLGRAEAAEKLLLAADEYDKGTALLKQTKL